MTMMLKSRALRVGALACGLAALLMNPAAAAPDAFFVQAGTAGSTHEASAGLVWDWKGWPLSESSSLTAHWELALSRWSYREAEVRKSAWLLQVAAIPVVRWRPNAGSSAWFVQGGIGATLTSRRYETDQKNFSTRFNFGDHLALGRSFGPRREREIALRLEHFSNAGIKHPNPGENFFELRYLQRL